MPVRSLNNKKNLIAAVISPTFQVCGLNIRPCAERRIGITRRENRDDQRPRREQAFLRFAPVADSTLQTANGCHEIPGGL